LSRCIKVSPVIHLRGFETGSRYSDLLTSKIDFFANAGDILDPEKNYYITTLFKEKYPPRYKDFFNMHYGLDLSRIGGSGGDPIYAGISGMATSINWNENNGESLQMEYGYNFEGSFIGTGLYGEYLHMEKYPNFKIGQYISSDTQIGTIGNTGTSTAPHLHYDIFSINRIYSETTLSILYGETARKTSFASTYGYKNVYDPELYYQNWLAKKLFVKDEWLKKYGGN
jgi:murein DD-endopeptidase MepM/ murein hydrolase activator NlpD